MTSDYSGDGCTALNDLRRLTRRQSFAYKKVVCVAREVLQEVSEEIERERRQKKKIDRIAQKAEAAQRLAKRGGWK